MNDNDQTTAQYPQTVEEETLLKNDPYPKINDPEFYLTAIKDEGVERSNNGRSSQMTNQEGNQNRFSQENADGTINIYTLYSEEELENFRCIFDMFDKEKSGFIDVADLQTIMKSLGRDPHEAIQLLNTLDLNPDGRLSFEEFLKIMKQLESMMVAAKDPNNEDVSPREASLEERTKYGSLLPRTGVHFLPDSKVVDFLKLLNDYRKKCCKEMNLTEAKRAQLKFDDLKSKETLRQMQNMRQAQESELVTVENAQRSQFLEFSQAWDNYMSDYEATAYLSLEKLKEKHLLEIQQLHERIRKEYKIKLKFTKELMEMKKQVHVLITLRRYDDAEHLKAQADAQEALEKTEMENQIEEILQKQEERLRAKQQMALAALLKRIQRDRNEQLKHRQIDSQRLIQRNKNLLLDLLNKQNTETRRTNSFLRFALGARSPDKKNYFKSKLYVPLEESRLNIPKENIKTQYNNKTNSAFALKNEQYHQQRAKTSKGNDQRSMSMEMKQVDVAAKTAYGDSRSNMNNKKHIFSNNRGSQSSAAKGLNTSSGSQGNKCKDDTSNKRSSNEVKLPHITK